MSKARKKTPAKGKRRARTARAKPKAASRRRSPVLQKFELATARARLIAKREDLLREMQRAELETKQLDAAGEVKDTADIASDAYERQFSSELSDAERRTLLEVEGALERIESGEYGLCISCGKKIPKARLDALPSARMCISCQSQKEQQRP